MSKLNALLQRFVDDGRCRFWVVVCVGLALFLVFAAAHGATYSARDTSGNVVTLYDKPCEAAELVARARPEFQPLIKHAAFQYKGRLLKACWLAMPDGNVHLIDEDMDVSVIPIGSFQKDVDA